MWSNYKNILLSKVKLCLIVHVFFSIRTMEPVASWTSTDDLWRTINQEFTTDYSERFLRNGDIVKRIKAGKRKNCKEKESVRCIAKDLIDKGHRQSKP